MMVQVLAQHIVCGDWKSATRNPICMAISEAVGGRTMGQLTNTSKDQVYAGEQRLPLTFFENRTLFFSFEGEHQRYRLPFDAMEHLKVYVIGTRPTKPYLIFEMDGLQPDIRRMRERLEMIDALLSIHEFGSFTVTFKQTSLQNFRGIGKTEARAIENLWFSLYKEANIWRDPESNQKVAICWDPAGQRWDVLPPGTSLLPRLQQSK